MFQVKRKSHVSVELHDYVLRAVVAKGPSTTNLQVVEIPLPVGVVQDGMIVDEMALFETMKENTSLLGGKKQPVRFFVPDTSVLLKQIEHPQDVEGKDLKSYVQMEVSHSIHLPFQEPLIDVHDPTPGDGKAVLFAAPPDEVNKFVNILIDNGFTPEVADIRAISNLRLLEHLNLVSLEKTYLVADWSINALVICIYSEGNIEFLRYQSIDTDLQQWTSSTDENGDIQFTYKGEIEQYNLLVTDQVLEIDRMMNFFKFSLHKGEKSVNEIIVLGDNPLLSNITALLKENFQMPLHTVNDALIESTFPGLKAKHSALIGLVLKGAKV